MTEQMKSSGIDWIGDIPESWKVKPIAYMTKSRSGGTPDRNNLLYWENGTIPWMSSGEVNKVNIYDTDEKITTLAVHHSSAKIISKNAVMVALNGQGKTKGMSAILRIDSACNQSLCAFSCNAGILYYEYLFWCFQTMYTYLRQMSGDDVRDGLAASYVKKQKIPVPKYEEQQAIADFLNKECAQIDGIAADLEKQISLLQQYKKSLITETVTKGLDKSVPMKDSGVEWIGEIPTHWDKKRMKYFLSVSSGEAITSDQLEDGEYPVYGGGKQMGYFNKANVDKNQILIGRVGANCGCVTITHTPSWATDNALVVQTLCYFKYIYYILISADLNRLNEANAQPLITGAKVGNCVVPFTANYTEQKQIAQYLDERCEKIEGLIIGKQKQLETIIQHKKSLIYEYVTGKKRVKEVQ